MDSPKCLACFDVGLHGQTYKVAGKPKFQCRSCGKIYEAGDFEPQAFLWKEDKVKWENWRESRKIKKDK